MYRVAVWDDNSIHLEELCGLTASILHERGVPFQIDPFTGLKELLHSVETGPPYELMLLDILCDGPLGMELAVTLRTRGVESSIIFVSSSPDFVLDGYDVHAVSYILKPPDRGKLADAIVYALRHRPVSQQLVAVKVTGGTRMIQKSCVLYLESKAHDVLIHLDTAEDLRTHAKLEAVSAQLPGIPLAQCHKSLCVSLARIHAVQGYELELDTGTWLPISRGRAREFKRAYLAYKMY